MEPLHSLREALTHTSLFCSTIGGLRKNQGKLLRTREVNVLLNEALPFTRFLFKSDRDILMKITLSRFEIRESVVFRDPSRSPKLFSACTKLLISQKIGAFVDCNYGGEF